MSWFNTISMSFAKSNELGSLSALIQEAVSRKQEK